MKLKTLKDLEMVSVIANEFCCHKLDGLIDKEMLRQNAINDIKAIRENEDNPPFLVDKPEQLIGYIMWKNNLTEKDLK